MNIIETLRSIRTIAEKYGDAEWVELLSEEIDDRSRPTRTDLPQMASEQLVRRHSAVTILLRVERAPQQFRKHWTHVADELRIELDRRGVSGDVLQRLAAVEQAGAVEMANRMLETPDFLSDNGGLCVYLSSFGNSTTAALMKQP